ncbi:phage baseplate assembly protein V [Dechloromonas sp. ARDL1]|uniref:phage baseplate assembly protein V n=1 Tax=Dechloromonas sp. ARDL1 TaxID=3322121 RepID=UPI003DA7A422
MPHCSGQPTRYAVCLPLNARWGSHFLPRIGTEVMVDFLDGDIDRPIVVGQAYNGADLPSFSEPVHDLLSKSARKAR